MSQGKLSQTNGTSSGKIISSTQKDAEKSELSRDKSNENQDTMKTTGLGKERSSKYHAKRFLLILLLLLQMMILISLKKFQFQFHVND